LKNFTLKVAAIVFMAALSFKGMAQKKDAHPQQHRSSDHDHQRCGTMEYYERLIQQDPTLPAKWKAEGDRVYNENLLKATAQRNARPNTPNSTNAIVYIPVVYHVVGTAANQAFATDEVLQRQLDVMNLDFAGLNPDSVKIPAVFKPLFGRSEIRFCLAKRTPTATATNGIERRVTSQTFTAATVGNLKKTSTGGLDQWDGSKYFNIWVANFTDGLLGIATFPNTGAANEQGVAIHTGSLDQPCGSAFAGQYDRGRTLTHEAGHYFYLFHIWGDDGGSCAGSDWGTPYGALPASCTDDTPNAGNSTFNCPTGVLTDACAPAASGGKMYQNYMDYTDDACMVMFTAGQICRAQGTLDLHRASLKTSDGCVPVGAPVTDARVSEILNPISRGFACGSTTSFCNPFAPQVLVVNDGEVALTSLVIESKVDGVVANTLNWTGNLAPGDFAYVTLAFVNSTPGGHILTVKTRNPNGIADGRPTNDSANARFNQSGGAGIALPISEGFEGTTFPPAGYANANPDNGITWARTTLAARTGIASMRVDFWNYSPGSGQQDLFQTPKVNTLGADVVRIAFDVAYARFSATAIDELEVVYSTDCGITWIPTGYRKSQLALATNGGATVTGGPFVPTASQWRRETIDLNIGCGPQIPSMIIGFRSYNRYGNNLYIDNINVSSVAGTALDASATSLSPIASPICPTGPTGTISPTFTFTNNGAATLTSATIAYRINNGTPVTTPWTGSLAKCASTSFTLPNITVSGGNNTITVYVTAPNGGVDLVPANDSARQTFYVQELIALPAFEGFETTTFPPAGGWRRTNPDNATTWQRSTIAARTGAAAMRIDLFNYAAQGQIDRVSTPNINMAGLDSLKLSFDVAYAQFSAAFSDTLEVLYSTDCGVTWLPTGYKKGGTQLNSIPGSPNVTGAFTPTAAQWRSEELNISTCNITAPTIMYAFSAKNGYGNNMYIDNIRLTPVTTAQYNAATLNIIDPPATLCANTFVPRVTIANYSGAGPLTSVVINYQVDNNPPAVFNWTGSLARCATTVVTLPSVTSTPGNHILTVYTTNPNSNADQRPNNDTVRKVFSISPIVATPRAEGFEGTTFPPADWNIQNPDGLVTWSRATGNARTGNGAMVIRNFTYPVANTVDRIFSPVMQNNASFDSLFVSFDYAYAQGSQYPGATARPLDTLEVLVTTDCGATFRTIWKKWGEDLQTINDPNNSNGLAFAPSVAMYKNVRLFITPFVGSTNFQVYFVAKSNRQNDLWIDNININSKTLPKRLKDQGYLVYPNPFENGFRIHHWQVPQDLRGVQIFNAAGQLVWDKRYSGNADTEIMVDMSKLAKGTYTLKMTYTTKVVIEKIVKVK
jgi:Pregnancy-associated plasma protein-A/Secretion system C-terminal sorting domain